MNLSAQLAITFPMVKWLLNNNYWINSKWIEFGWSNGQESYGQKLHKKNFGIYLMRKFNLKWMEHILMAEKSI